MSQLIVLIILSKVTAQYLQIRMSHQSLQNKDIHTAYTIAAGIYQYVFERGILTSVDFSNLHLSSGSHNYFAMWRFCNGIPWSAS
jgi:hypothetical protein